MLRKSIYLANQRFIPIQAELARLELDEGTKEILHEALKDRSASEILGCHDNGFNSSYDALSYHDFKGYCSGLISICPKPTPLDFPNPNRLA